MNPHSGCSAPRLGFLGVGWIGRHRLEAVVRSGIGQVVGIADTSAELAATAARLIPNAQAVTSLEQLFALEIEGLVIATPSALHAAQAEAALRRGIAVFCQKPLGRSGSETRRVIDAARQADRLLGVDLSYRHLSGVRQIRELCQSGELGGVFAADLVFHNAYGPDKPWFYDPELSGGGCLMDLGIHLVDLGLWTLGFPGVAKASGRLFVKGEPLVNSGAVEDYVVARLDLETGACLRLTCSWNLHAGREAVISGAFYGTNGGAMFHNVNGSFYEFRAEHFNRTSSRVLSDGPEEWGGRSIVEWATRLASDQRFDPEIETLGKVATALDSIYGIRTTGPGIPITIHVAPRLKEAATL